MRKILLFSLLIIFALSACEKEEQGPEQKPDERINEILDSYKSQLVGSTFGWKAILYPEGGAGYNFLFQFTDNDRVQMYSDINATTAAEAMNSSYRLQALQRPALLFDTYSYLHMLADPDAEKSGGDWGEGQYSDFEFSFESASADTIILSGNYNNSRLVLIRATEDASTNYIGRIAATAAAFENIANFTTYFKRLTLGSQAYDISVHIPSRQITFSYYEGDFARSFTTTYYYTENGLVLLEPFTTSQLTIRSLNVPQYNAAAGSISLKINNDLDASIREATSPVKTDRQAVQQFFNAPGEYWISFYGFTIEGVEDALQVTSIPDYSFLIYWPRFNRENGTEYDLLGFVADNSIQYGIAAIPSFTNDGRIVYTLFGTLGADNIPAGYESIVTALQEQWTRPEGYYVVQTGPNTYDLVSAEDAKSWISFR